MFNQLKNYYAILAGKKRAKFWKANLDKLIEEVREIMKSCELCERKCKVNRLKGEIGHCKVPNKMLISSEFLHFGEEPFFVPSHTIFLMGCTMHCQFCQNYTISQWLEKGYEIFPEILALKIEERKMQGSKNVNFVGGEPTPYLLFILQTLKELKNLKVNLPIIWNSNFYMSEKTMNILNQIIDVFLSDFKYGNNRCAKDISLVENYFDIISRNHLLAKGEIVIRHLILPNHIKCCSFPILEWISNNLGKKCIVNLMDQYYPCYNILKKEKFRSLRRRITLKEFEEVKKRAEELNLIYIC